MKKYITTKSYNQLSDEDKKSGNYIVTKDVSVTANSTEDLTATTGNPDTDNDVIKPDGIDTSIYENNPVVLWQHNRDMPPVGKCISLKKIDNNSNFGNNLKNNIKGSGGWIGTVQFMTQDVDEFSYKIFKMIKGGFLNAVSIGFMVNDMENNSLGGYNILKSKLYEFSIVTVPANSECLVIPNESKSVTTQDTDDINLRTNNVNDLEKKDLTQSEPETLYGLIDNAVNKIDELTSEITNKISYIETDITDGIDKASSSSDETCVVDKVSDDISSTVSDKDKAGNKSVSIEVMKIKKLWNIRKIMSEE